LFPKKENGKKERGKRTGRRKEKSMGQDEEKRGRKRGRRKAVC